MKIKTANQRIHDAIDQDDYVKAAALLKKYQRKFGNRKFTYWTRLTILNGLWMNSFEAYSKLQLNGSTI
jgi:hypothetical protein